MIPPASDLCPIEPYAADYVQGVQRDLRQLADEMSRNRRQLTAGMLWVTADLIANQRREIEWLREILEAKHPGMFSGEPRPGGSRGAVG